MEKVDRLSTKDYANKTPNSNVFDKDVDEDNIVKSPKNLLLDSIGMVL